MSLEPLDSDERPIEEPIELAEARALRREVPIAVEAPIPIRAPEERPIPEATAEVVRGLLGELAETHRQLGEGLSRWKADEARLRDAVTSKQSEIDTVVKSCAKRLGLAGSWHLDLLRLVFRRMGG